jgi:hypothetical protein
VRIHLFSEPSLAPVCAEFGFIRRATAKVTSLDLGRTADDLWADMSAKRRNGIRYARKHGIIVRHATLGDLDACTRVWVEGFCVKFHKPADDFHIRVGDWIGLGRLLLAQLGADGPVIAGVVYRDGNESSEADRYFQPGVYGVYSANSSLTEYQKYKPNDLLVWEAALCMKAQGYREFVLGHAGVRFKHQFSRRQFTVDSWVRNRGVARLMDIAIVKIESLVEGAKQRFGTRSGGQNSRPARSRRRGLR